MGDLADARPSVAAIDLQASLRSKSAQTKVIEEGETVSASDGDNGRVAYRYVGVTPSGTHVLVVMVNGGGSGVFEDVLWVRFVRDAVNEDGQKRERTMLVKVGTFTLGDRDDGRVALDGTKLLIGRSRHRDADRTIPLE